MQLLHQCWLPAWGRLCGKVCARHPAMPSCGPSYCQADTAVSSSAYSQMRLPIDIFPTYQAIL